MKLLINCCCLIPALLIFSKKTICRNIFQLGILQSKESKASDKVCERDGCARSVRSVWMNQDFSYVILHVESSPACCFCKKVVHFV